MTSVLVFFFLYLCCCCCSCCCRCLQIESFRHCHSSRAVVAPLSHRLDSKRLGSCFPLLVHGENKKNKNTIQHFVKRSLYFGKQSTTTTTKKTIMSDRLHQTQTNHNGGYPFEHRSAQSQYEHGCLKKWTEDDLEMAGTVVSTAVGNRDEGYNDDGGLLLQDFVHASSSSSPHSFGSSTTTITRRRRRRQRKTINNNYNDNNNDNNDNMLLDESGSSLVVHDGGGYYAPTSTPPPPPPTTTTSTSTTRTASSRITSTQLWMTSSKHHKELGEEAVSLSSSTSPSKTRIVGKRRRGAWKVVSSFLSSMRSSSSSSSPLNMMTNRGLQPEEPSSLEEDDNDDMNNGKNEWNTSTSTSVDVKKQLSILQQENDILRKQVTQLSQENQRLHQSHHRQRIILEQFEGEGQPMLDVNGDVIDSMWWEKNGYTEGGDYENGTIVVTRSTDEYNTVGNVGGGGEIAQVGDGEMITHGRKNLSTAVASSKDKKQPWQQQQRPPEQEECAPQDYNDGTCPIEPDISFRAALKDRAYWLVGLLTLQSMSGFILARNEELLQTHPVIVYFLTMLVGAGGNAGNQAAVRVIRGIALGTLNDRTQRQFLQRELKMATSLSVILSLAGFIRAVAFGTPFPETFAVTSALAIIVFTSICFGAILPLILRKVDVDPAHSSTTIQVIMDILGVVLTVAVSTTILDSPIGQVIINKLTGGGVRS